MIVWVKPESRRTPTPDWPGHFVRVVGLYSGRFDPTQTQTTIEIWTDRPSDIAVTGTIDSHPLFDRPVTPVNQIYEEAPETWVKVRGHLDAHDLGASLVVRDDTGQVLVNSIQKERVPTGAEVEAIGRVSVVGSQWVLDRGLFRRARSGGNESAESAPGAALRTIDQIRRLSMDEAAQGPPVRITGMVAWSLPEADFFYLQDAGAGIRVHFDRANFEPPPLGKYLQVDGVTVSGEFAPIVELRRTVDLGSMSPPNPRLITLDEALSGRADGQFVAIRGFLQRVVSEHDWRWIHVTTPAGEFVGHLQSPVNFVANPGSLLRVRGVCETTVDANGRVTGVTLRVPFLHDILIEEDAPADPFDLPLRSLKSVNHFGNGQMLMRTRIAGTVVGVTAAKTVYVQDGDSGLLLLGRDPAALRLGDRIEAVGILGREGVRMILRDAMYRKTGASGVPEPVVLAEPERAVVSLDSRLVRVRGTLIDAVARPNFVRLTLQAGATLFEARLEGAMRPALPAIGAGLELTGVYRLVFDDVRQSRGFELQLRSPADLTVYRPAQFWTLNRALAASAILGGAVLLGVAWITALRRRVARQTEQIRAQLEHQARLEAEVQRAARLESLGTLAGGIAHDFNNLLTIVLGNTTLAMSDSRIMHAAGEYLEEIERGARRARELAQQLLTFAKGGTPRRSSVELSRIIREEIDPLVTGTAVRCDYDFAAELPTAHVDPDQIARVVHAIALNAVQAMPRGGRLRVLLREVEILPGSPSGLTAGHYLRIIFSDTGEGIPADVLPKIFDPYFTTKHAGGGLGLATVYSIVRRHDGRIEAESTPGHGATFTVWLPTAPAVPIAAHAAAAVESVAPAPEKRTPRVLVMDDEESIRRVIEIVLQRLGVEPVVVSDGEAALREFKAATEQGRPIDLLILDLTIPGGVGGRQVIEVIRQTAPTVPAIVSSGYSNDPVLAQYKDYGFQAVVQKPYDVRQLAAMVSRFVGHLKPEPRTS